MIRVKLSKVVAGGKELLKNFNLSVGESEVHLIAGPSGSGKSVLLKLVAGLIPTLYRGVEVYGEVVVNGLRPEEALMNGLTTYVPQDLSTSLIGDSLEDTLRLLGLSTDYVIIKRLGIRDYLSRGFNELSAGIKYRVLTALVTHLRPKVLLLDEPSTYVDLKGLHELLKLINELSSEYGTSVLIADHRVDVISKYCDEVHYLGGTTSCSSCDVISKSLGYLSINDLWFKYSGSDWVIKGLNLDLSNSSLICFVGSNGCGKTTLARLIIRFLRPTKGSIKVPSKLFYVPQEPTYWLVNDDLLSAVKELSTTEPNHLINAVGLNPRSSPYSLSVGEVRRLSIYLALTSRADLVIIDEPTIGLDFESRECVKEVMWEAVSSGKLVTVMTHDMSFAKELMPDELIELGD